MPKTKSIILLLPLIFTITFVNAQSVSFEIKGSVVSDTDDLPLESATVYLQKVKDSSVVSYTITNAQGNFILQDITSEKQLNLFVSYVGYQLFKKKIDITKGVMDLKKITMTPANTLDEVVIKSIIPVKVKKDTLEFNVNAFKTKTNATVEDLLKKLPGVEVSSDGQIKVNGREVNKILVNGKPFFSNDPTIATRSLSKDFIEKVQITQTKTKEQAFSGEKGSDTKRTINFVIKKDKGKGTFGRLAGGIGTNDRYEFAGILNYFNDDRRLSALGGGNNINSPGFSFGEIQKMFGTGESSSKGKNNSFEIDGRQFGGEDGIITSANAGLNYTDDIGKTVDYSGNYFYSDANSIFEKTATRENLIPDSEYISKTSTDSDNAIKNHIANLDFDIVVDSTFLITLKPSIRNSNGTKQYTQNQESNSIDGALINSAQTRSSAKTKANNFSNMLGFTKRIGEKGAFVKFKFNTEFNNNETEDKLFTALNTFGDMPTTEIRNLLSDEDYDTNTIDMNSTFRLPLKGYSLFLDFKYRLNSQRKELIKNTFDFNDSSQQYDQWNVDFSASTDYLDQQHSPSLSLGFVKNKSSLTLGVGYDFIELNNKDAFHPEANLNRNFSALQADVFYAYNFKPGTLLNISYSSHVKTPNFNALQTYQNINNPLNTVVGNPNLQLSREHHLFGIYNTLNFEKGLNFNMVVNASFIDNQIVSSTYTYPDLTSETTYQNVDGFYQIGTDLGFGKKKRISEKETFKYNLGLNASISNYAGFNNGELTNTKIKRLTPNIRFNYVLKEILEIEPLYSVDFSNTKFDLNNSKQNVVKHNVRLNTNLSMLKNLEWQNSIHYNYNPNVSPGFQKNTVLWNMTLDYSFLKNKAIASLKVYDLLNQNTDVYRASGSNFIEDTQSTILQRYAMLSFSWRFDSFNEK